MFVWNEDRNPLHTQSHTFQTFPRTAPASEAGVNSSLTDRVLRVETTPFPHLKQLGWDSNLSWLGTRLHEYMGIPMASLVGFIERHGVYYISVHAK